MAEIRVMTYNVQDFRGINRQQEMQNRIIAGADADIIGFQEFCPDGVVPEIASRMLEGYPALYLSSHINYIAIASRFALRDVRMTDYETQDPHDIADYNETRGYLRGYLTIGGRDICVMNTHLAFREQKYITGQMKELKEAADKEENLILLGDFNFYGLSVHSVEYRRMYAPFVKSGYRLANCTAKTGFRRTFTAAESAAGQAGMATAPDNIIVSRNIEILDTRYDLTKLSCLNGYAIDHIPVICTLKV